MKKNDIDLCFKANRLGCFISMFTGKIKVGLSFQQYINIQREVLASCGDKPTEGMRPEAAMSFENEDMDIHGEPIEGNHS